MGFYASPDIGYAWRHVEQPALSNTPETSLTVLCVDLDGTLIHGDVSFTTFFMLLKANPLRIFSALLWLFKGRVHLKREIAKRVQLDPASLSYRDELVMFLKEEKAKGRKLVLATASDQYYADVISTHLGDLFDEALGSDGVINLSSSRKCAALKLRYGKFSYIGNSRADFKVWAGAEEAFVAGAPAWVIRKLETFKSPARIFT